MPRVCVSMFFCKLDGDVAAIVSRVPEALAQIRIPVISWLKQEHVFLILHSTRIHPSSFLYSSTLLKFLVEASENHSVV